MKITRHQNTFDLIATIPLTGNAFVLLGALPGYSRWIDRSLRFRPTGANMQYIIDNWPGADWQDDHARACLELHQNTEKTRAEISETKHQVLTDNGDYEYLTVPYDHQKQAFLLSRDQDLFALLMEQGTGKTKVIIDNAAYLYEHGKIEALVVIAPNGVHENWIINELPRHMPERIETSLYTYAPKYTKKEMAKIEKAIEAPGLKIFAFNVEGFVSVKAKGLLERLLKKFECMVVVDESTRIKNNSAKRTRYLIKTCKGVKRKRILTGTPITKGAENLYSQFGFLSPMIIGHDTYTSFKRQYCITKEIGFGEMIVGYKNSEELTTKIDGYSYRVRKADCLDLPPKVYTRAPFHLSPAENRLYTELRDEYVTEFDGQEITAEMALTRLLRLQQIASGFWPLEGGKIKPIEETSSRMKALRGAVEDIDGKVIIWARFVGDLDNLEKEFAGECIRYRGKLEQANQFQEDESIKYFMSNPVSGGIGLTLTAASTVIYYSNSFDLEHRLQSEDRAHRIGQENKVTYIDLEAVGTIDRKIINALRAKKLISDAILQDPSGFFLENGDMDQIPTSSKVSDSSLLRNEAVNDVLAMFGGENEDRR